MRRFLIGTLGLFAVLLLAFYIEGGNPLDFLLPTPLAIDLLVPACAALAVWGFKDWGRAWKDAFARTASPSAATSAKLWAFYETTCYISGIVGFILGLNVIFSFQGGVEPGKIFRPLAVACVAPILAIFLAMVARILKARVIELSEASRKG
jgi:hypothetical protein